MTDGTRIVHEARRWLGTPYLHQGSQRDIGCDCLGLIAGIWRALTGKRPEVPLDYPSAWVMVDPAETMLVGLRRYLISVHAEQLIEPGDVAAFRMTRKSAARHLGVLTGEGTFIHAYEAKAVVETTLSKPWERAIAARFRFPELPEVR